MSLPEIEEGVLEDSANTVDSGGLQEGVGARVARVAKAEGKVTGFLVTVVEQVAEMEVVGSAAVGSVVVVVQEVEGTAVVARAEKAGVEVMGGEDGARESQMAAEGGSVESEGLG